MKRLIFFPLVALVGILGLSACSENGTDPMSPSAAAVDSADAPIASQGAPAPGDDPIAALAIAEGLGELVGALTYVDEELGTGLVDLFLTGTDQYTVFAPNDQAFGNLYALLTAVLGADIDEIRDVPAPVVLDVLRYHVTEGRRAANSVLPRNRERTIETLLGETFDVRPDATIRDGLTGLRDDATIVRPNLSASNGIIHVIDEVIVSPAVVAELTN